MGAVVLDSDDDDIGRAGEAGSGGVTTSTADPDAPDFRGGDLGFKGCGDAG